jgi:Lamin Tail Domain
MKINQLLIFLIFPLQIFAQLNENFSDGDFSINPEWSGDTSSFRVDPNLQLQSQGAAVTENIYLSTANSRLSDTEWKFYVRLEFNPSSGNFAKFYLCSDSSDLTGPLNGYYLKIGGVTGNTDAIDLYRQEGISSVKIISGIPGHAGRNINRLRIRVIRGLAGEWTLFSDTLGGNNFMKEGSCIDSTLKTSKYTGLLCHHSSTRGSKFFFDDIIIQQAPIFPYSAKVVSDSTVIVFFNKALQGSSTGDISDYLLSNVGNPVSVIYNPANPNQINLIFAGKLAAGSYSLSIQNIIALSGETIAPGSSIDFNYVKPLAYGSLIIDEIFADPSPAVGLPEAEYIELYNRGSDTINFSGFIFSDGSTDAVIPYFKFAPDSYLILCSSSFAPAFSSYGNTLGLSSWPSLNNSGDSLKIYDASGRIIFSVAYSDSWYKDVVKKAGGWSLEMIDHDNLCGESENWAASENDNGGTPGKINSINAHKPDLDAPILLKAEAQDSVTIKLYYNEKLDNLAYKHAVILLSPEIAFAKKKIEKTDLHCVIISLDAPLQNKILYTITIENMTDCSGNISPKSSATLAMPEKALPGDIIINEVLFNPRVGGVDFVEIYNKSDKYLDLSDWQIANMQNGLTANRKVISSENFIMMPHSYIFLSEDPQVIKDQYPSTEIAHGMVLSSMPSYNDDEGSVILLYNNTEADRFDYLDNYHFKLLTDQEGVSLERISFDQPTNSAGNWHSAAETAGFATPGYKNSQLYTGDGKGFFVDPPVFTPDEDGYKDFTTIHFHFDKPGYIGNLTMFDAQGREIRRLTQNQSLANDGFFQWDGTSDAGKKVESGYFIILFEVFNLDGEVRKYKETVVVAEK